MTARAPVSAAEIARLLGRPEPTAEQTRVIEGPLEPTLVVAGAGSGKTETMAARVVWLIANGLVRPEAVLGLTFTRKAAAELADRVHRRLAQLARARGEAAVLALDRPVVSTYNSYAAALVAEHALRIGVEPDARVLTAAAAWQTAAEVVESWAGDLETDAAISTLVGAVLDLDGQLGEHLLEPDRAADGIDALLAAVDALPYGPGRKGHYADVRALCTSLRTRRLLLEVVLEYRRRKRAGDLLGFADQVALAARLAREVPTVGRGERARFDVVLLDEYQDTSHAQAELLVGLFGGGHPVTAVGDPHQSIYGWRGASAGGLSRFPQRFARSPAAGGGPAAVRYLSTSWRNDHAILRAANLVAEPLRRGAGVPVPELGARPGAGPGAVGVAFPATVEEEAGAVAGFVAARWRPASSPEGPTTAAVLCRTRAQFAQLEVALRSRGLPVEVVGLGGLLATAEVTDVVALLQAVHDPSRGDSLMRLLTGPRLNLGAADLHALASWASDLARIDGLPAPGRRRPPAAGGDGGGEAVDPNAVDPNAVGPNAVGPGTAVVRAGDVVDHRSIVDALDELPPPGHAAADGRVLSAAARGRLAALARGLRRLRSLTYLSLPELVAEAECVLGLDIEVAVATAPTGAGGPSGGGPAAVARARAALDAFRDVAAQFVRDADVPTLGAFLAWLNAATVRDRGLDAALHEPDPDAVQVITVHAAKGLEWDVVAVPGLVDGLFPTVESKADGPVDSGWLTSLSELPFPLRGDAAELPVLDLPGAVDGVDLEQRRRAFRLANGAHQVAEERRLAYVAWTRARRELLLTGCWWRDGVRPRRPSPFLAELVDAGLADIVTWQPEPGDENPRPVEPEGEPWPVLPDTPLRAAIRRSAAAVRAEQDRLAPAAGVGRAAGGEPPATAAADSLAPAGGAVLGLLPPAGEVVVDDGTDLGLVAALVLAERARLAEPVRDVAVPPHLAASGLVRLAADRAAFALDLRRPVPTRPTVHAARGTRFHLWVQRYFAASSLLDPWDLPGADDDTVEVDLDRLRETFLASPWAQLTPIAVEVDIETPVAGAMLRSRIDAVFPATGAGRGGAEAVVVVDWKTGHEPTDAAARRAREVQLAVYRLAWSRWSGLTLDQVHAAFYYVSSDRTVWPERLLDEAEIEALLHG